MIDPRPDPRVAALAAALANHKEAAEQAIHRETRRWESHFCGPDCPAAILAALPADWCGHGEPDARDHWYEEYVTATATIARLRAIEEAARAVAETWDAPVYVGQADHYGATAGAIDALRAALAAKEATE